MTNKNAVPKHCLTPFWRKITDEASEILINEIKELRDKTIAPAFCLAAQDKHLMERRARSIKGAKAVLETVRKGGFWGKTWALDTVLRHKPSILWG